jgi:hypothetical protein
MIVTISILALLLIAIAAVAIVARRLCCSWFCRPSLFSCVQGVESRYSFARLHRLVGKLVFTARTTTKKGTFHGARNFHHE